jgi:hypothetical protein
MDKVLETILKETRDRKAFVSEELTRGTVSDFAAYQKLCGEIRGYSLIEDYILDLAKHMESADE